VVLCSILLETSEAKVLKKNASVMTYIRIKFRFALLRSTVAAMQGFQGKQSNVLKANKAMFTSRI